MGVENKPEREINQKETNQDTIDPNHLLKVFSEHVFKTDVPSAQRERDIEAALIAEDNDLNYSRQTVDPWITRVINKLTGRQ